MIQPDYFLAVFHPSFKSNNLFLTRNSERTEHRRRQTQIEIRLRNRELIKHAPKRDKNTYKGEECVT